MEDKLLLKIGENSQIAGLFQKVNQLEIKNTILANSQKVLEEKLQSQKECNPQIAELRQKIGHLEARNENLENSHKSAMSLNVMLSLSFSIFLIASTVYAEFFYMKKL